MSYTRTAFLRRLRAHSGFTIVELLIVIAVIGILVVIGVVAYNGVTSRAVTVSMQSDLEAAETVLTSEKLRNGVYPANASSVNGGQGLSKSGDNILTYVSDGKVFCVTASSPNTPQAYYLDSINRRVKSGACSDAGNTWVARAAPAGTWRKITYGNGLFLMAADGNLAAPLAPSIVSTSINGTSWSSTYNVGTAATSDPTPIYAGGQFVIIFDSGAVHSATSTNNGKTWQHNTPGGIGGHLGNAIAYGNGTYVRTRATPPQTYSQVYTSTDGRNWTLRTTSIAWTGWYSIVYADGKFVAVSNSGTNQVMTSADGISWTLAGATPSGSWSSITYGNGLFVAVANNGTNRIMTSPNGTTWTARTAPEANGWTSVTYGAGKFVAVANNGTNRVMTSLDGITWVARPAAEANPWSSVAYGGGCFVAIASTGTNRVMNSCW